MDSTLHRLVHSVLFGSPLLVAVSTRIGRTICILASDAVGIHSILRVGVDLSKSCAGNYILLRQNK